MTVTIRIQVFVWSSNKQEIRVYFMVLSERITFILRRKIINYVNKIERSQMIAKIVCSSSRIYSLL